MSHSHLVGGALVAALVAGALAAPAARAQLTFTPINVPGATSTYAWGVNGTGQIVGAYVDATGTHGFLDNAGSFTTLDVPGARGTSAYGINATGQIVGGFTDNVGVNHGFLYAGGGFGVLDVPGATTTVARGINAAGQISGSYTDHVVNGQHGFLDNAGVFTPIDALVYTYATGINDAGQVVGYYFTPHAGPYAFLYSGGVVTDLRTGAAATGINNAGQIVGYDSYPYTTSGVGYHGFVRDAGGAMNYFDVPGAADTYAEGINAAGLVVGYYDDATRGVYGFLATPAALTAPEPGTLGLLGAGLVGISGVVVRRRRPRWVEHSRHLARAISEDE